ncbi:MAG TPA: pyruvate dehydrogenase (acetyl-transferring) E1 component subunit alpha [Candidatus Bilamarchaeaceae archaeon]|nr:pyruvate dehydrogenase (acetyl-transferring) E1 component subunit alpha [Candidatus Bilamarchaeaceae archaeon]
MPLTDVFQGKISHLQILDKDGKADPKLEPKLPQDLLLRMYTYMVLARAFDDKCLKLQRQGRMYTYAPLLGQEAAQIGSAAALEPSDWMFPTYRDNGSYLYRGVPMKDLMVYWMGAEKGFQFPKDQNNYTALIPIATQIPHAVGAAWAAKIKGDKIASIVYFGDGATSEGDFHAGMNFAGVFQVPCVLFCQNNQWAISVPRKKQTASSTIAQKALAYGFNGIQVDGNDVLAVYAVVHEALKKAREGKGPTLIEALTYRMGAHTTADDPTKYRTEEDVKHWQERDPVKRFQTYLKNKGYWNDELEKKTLERVKQEIEKATEAAEVEAAKVNPEEMFQYVYHQITPRLEEQMEEMKEYLKSKG